jgi:hypothetical protein
MIYSRDDEVNKEAERMETVTMGATEVWVRGKMTGKTLTFTPLFHLFDDFLRNNPDLRSDLKIMFKRGGMGMKLDWQLGLINWNVLDGFYTGKPIVLIFVVTFIFLALTCVLHWKSLKSYSSI